MKKSFDNSIPAHLQCMTSQTRADCQGEKRPDIKLERIHPEKHISNRLMRSRGLNYTCTKPRKVA